MSVGSEGHAETVAVGAFDSVRRGFRVEGGEDGAEVVIFGLRGGRSGFEGPGKLLAFAFEDAGEQEHGFGEALHSVEANFEEPWREAHGVGKGIEADGFEIATDE